MPQHFIKIEIKGDKRNLPKENGIYSVHSKRDINQFNYHDSTWMNLYAEAWIRDYDFYLLPVPEPQQPEQTESTEIEEILKRNIKISYEDDFCHEEYHSFPVLKDSCFSNAANELHKTFSQSHNNTVVGPSIEEIKKQADIYEREYQKSLGQSDPMISGLASAYANDDFIQGAKWFRSQVREVELKEELVKFAKHITDKDFPYSICYGEPAPFCQPKEDFTCDEIVDDYLSARKEGE